MQKWSKIAILFIICYIPLVLFAEAQDVPLLHANINFNDQASLQRGAKWFMNYCSGCHSLQYLRYNRLASDLDIVDSNGNISEQLVKQNLIFAGSSISSPIDSTMNAADAVKWFGIAPPDLTLETRIRGVDWVYTYLMSFYADSVKPWGTNNLLKPGVAMPNVLVNLQGTQIAIYSPQSINNNKKTVTPIIDHLVLTKAGAMSPVQFKQTVNDLVNFLAYTAEPVRAERTKLGIWVTLFLAIFAVLAYILKREFWKDVK